MKYLSIGPGEVWTGCGPLDAGFDYKLWFSTDEFKMYEMYVVDGNVFPWDNHPAKKDIITITEQDCELDPSLEPRYYFRPLTELETPFDLDGPFSISFDPNPKSYRFQEVNISTTRYKELLAAEKILSQLEAAGVDNWEGYPGLDDEDDEYEQMMENNFKVGS
jgi:hypothetical protein